MKTILYNPIFINPQAYYVFPQLYDIEKWDSFIEPAVYSGYLIIEDLISNTSSQVINTREVDFTEFAGKRIRISQYTNIGAVVLGEWLLPEGEPSGPSFHQSLVDAWFMSGLSNNDKPSSIRGVKGNDLALKNFAYSLSSGFGKYEIDFNSWTKNVNAANFTNSDSVIHLTEILVADSKFLQTVDTDKLYIGCLRNAVQCMKGAIYYFALYNKSLTPEEIETEKERLNEEWLKRKTE